MAEQNQAPGQHWDGFKPGQTPAPEVNGVFRAYVDGQNIRVVPSQYGQRFRVPMRISLGSDGERNFFYFCPYNMQPKSKFIALLKAINGISVDIPEDFDLSQLQTSGDVFAEVVTNDQGYLEVKNVMILPRLANGTPIEPSMSVQPQRVAVERPDGIDVTALQFPDGRVVNADTGELIDPGDVPY